jgi:hypothetical protein
MDDWERYGVDGQYPGYSEFFFDELTPELLRTVQYPDSIEFDMRTVPVYDPAINVTVDIPTALIPLLAGLIRVLEWESVWDDPAAGYQLAALLQERLGTGTPADYWQALHDALDDASDCTQCNQFLADLYALMSAAHGSLLPHCLPTGMVEVWPLSEAGGTRAGAHAGLNLTDNNTVGSDSGKFGPAAQFIAANNEYLSIDDPALQAGDIDFTLSCWIYRASSDARCVIGKWDYTTGNREYALMIDAGSRHKLSFLVNPFGYAAANAQVDISIIKELTWYFVVCWHDATANTINIRINNYHMNSVSHSGGIHAANSTFCIGSLVPGGLPWDGMIAYPSVFKRLLSDNEQSAMWNRGNGLVYP